MSSYLITAQTGAATSAQFFVGREGMVISANGLAGAEYVDILVEHGNTFVTAGTANRLTATDPVRTLDGRGNYKVSKSATVAAVSVAPAFN